MLKEFLHVVAGWKITGVCEELSPLEFFWGCMWGKHDLDGDGVVEY